MKMEVCPCCKRPLGPKVKLDGPVQQRIFDYVSEHPDGVPMSKIIDAVYFDDPNGGPLGHIRDRIWVLNNKLKERGYNFRVRSERRGRGALYSIVEIKPESLQGNEAA